MGECRKGKRVLQWHPAFYAGLIIEFGEEGQKVYFENEHQLGTKPKEIDVLIIKKNSDEPIEKNIGQIFRKHNLVEYKSPDDYLSIDDFYRVHGYASFYKADTPGEDIIKAEEITISFVCRRWPRKLIKHLQRDRKYEICKFEKGIYYINGDIFAMQLIITSRLAEEQNFWLSNLTNDISEPEEVRKIAEEYQKNKDNKLYSSVMNIIVQANEEIFREEKTMCQAIIELFRDEYDAGIKQATEAGRRQGMEQGRRQGIEQGMQQGIEQGMQQGIEQGRRQGILQQLVDLVRDNLLSLDEAVKRAGITREEFIKQL